MDRKGHGLAGTLFVISTLLLAQHLAGAAGEESVFRGTATLLLGGAVFMGITMWETRGLTGLLVAQEGGAILADQTSLAWLAWLAWIGVVIGGAHLAVGLFGISLGAASPLPLVLGNVWFVVVGIIFMRQGQVAAPAYAGEMDHTLETPRNSSKRRIESALDVIEKVLPVLDTGEERLTEVELGLGTPFHLSLEQVMGDRDVGSRSAVYALAPVPYEIPPGEPGRPDESRAPVSPAPFECVTGAEEDRVGLDLEEVPQPVDRTKTVKARPRTFHQWLNGGRLGGALAQALHENAIEDLMEFQLKEVEAGSSRREVRHAERAEPQSRAFREWLSG